MVPSSENSDPYPFRQEVEMKRGGSIQVVNNLVTICLALCSSTSSSDKARTHAMTSVDQSYIAFAGVIGSRAHWPFKCNRYIRRCERAEAERMVGRYPTLALAYRAASVQLTRLIHRTLLLR